MHSCFKCNRNEPEVSFSKRGNGKLNSYCVECQRAYSRAHYLKHKATHNKGRQQRTKAFRGELKKFVWTLKDKPCVDCKVKYAPWIMQFDHLKDKEIDVSNAVSKLWSRERITQEVAKCELVCANCHADRTYKRQRGIAQPG